MENIFEKAVNLDDLTALDRHNLNRLYLDFTDFTYQTVYPSFSEVEMSRPLELYQTGFKFRLTFPANHCPGNRDLFIELAKIWNTKHLAFQTIQVLEAQVDPLYSNKMIFEIQVLFRPVELIGQLQITF